MIVKFDSVIRKSEHLIANQLFSSMLMFLPTKGSGKTVVSDPSSFNFTTISSFLSLSLVYVRLGKWHSISRFKVGRMQYIQHL